MVDMDITATDAKQRFGDIFTAALSGNRVNVTRHGKPAISIITAERMDELERVEDRAAEFIFEESHGEPWPPLPGD